LILLTGFGPFGRISKNLSSEIVREINSKISYHQIIKKILPVSWKKSIKCYKKTIALSKTRFELVILLGIHSSKLIYIEKFGWNLAFGKDIENKFKFGIAKFGFPLRMKTILDINQIYTNLKDRTNISISCFAGTFVCNYLYYWALFISNEEYPVIFIHVPQNLDLLTCLEKIEEIIEIAIRMHKKK